MLGQVTAPTLTGPVSLTIPSGASSGRIMRLRGRGIMRAGQKTGGDQLVELKIVTPQLIYATLRDFLVEWRKSQSDDPRVALQGEAAS